MPRKLETKARRKKSRPSHNHSPHEPLNRDFRGLNLAGRDLTGANLVGADFRGAILDSANFSRAKLSGSNFIGCELFWTDFVGAELEDARFEKAIFREADLTGTNLKGTYFTKAMIFGGSMRGADLSYAHLFEAEFDNVDLTGANFSNSRCGGNRFCNLDLGSSKGLGRVLHQMPSSVGIETIVLSGSKISGFLQGAGVPKLILDYVLSASAQPLELYSCFISYSSKDDLFAKRLYYDLRVFPRQRGVHNHAPAILWSFLSICRRHTNNTLLRYRRRYLTILFRH
jgi:hypothetical protein